MWSVSKQKEDNFVKNPTDAKCAVPYAGKRSPGDVNAINVDSYLNMIDLFSVHTFKSCVIVAKVKSGSEVSLMKKPQGTFYS